MKTKKVIETNIETVIREKFLYFEPQEENEEGFFVNDDPDTLKESAEHFGVSEELLKAIDEAIRWGIEGVVEKVQQDLIDIWKEIEELKE